MKSETSESKGNPKPEYGSDLMVDLLKALDIEYVALNPGATCRGIHDSIVNYGGNKNPEVILCNHEEMAVSLAQGYTKAALRPMVAMVHDIVGLLHATMAIYLAWLDQTPVLVLGGTGPMPYENRRPRIDWIHTALVQGNQVRDYVKWDDQPASLGSVPDAFFRAYRIATTEPRGPVYLCLDAGLQESKLTNPIELPSVSRYAAPSPPQADPAAIEKAADLLVQAQHPVVIADYMGRNPSAVTSLVELAELLSLPVLDACSRFNIPNQHPMDLTGAEAELLKEADVVLALDASDLYKALTKTDRVARRGIYMIPRQTKIIDISLRDTMIRSWSQHIGQLQEIDIAIIGDTSLALPALVAACKKAMTKSTGVDYKKRFETLRLRHEELRRQWEQAVVRTREEKPISLPRLASDLWEVVKDYDWVLVNRLLQRWTRRLWEWTKSSQYPGIPEGQGGVGYGIAHSLGGALAHKGTDRLCIDIQPDGDCLYAATALWTAAHHKIPLLVVMFNNRSYYNSQDHQATTAKERNRPTTNAGIGTSIDNPPVDFARLAQSLGVYGEGPIEEPAQLKPALERAVKHVMEEKACALVDVITQPR